MRGDDDDDTPQKLARLEDEVASLRRQLVGQRLRASRAEVRIDAAVSKNTEVVSQHARKVAGSTRMGSEIVVKKARMAATRTITFNSIVWEAQQ